MSRTMVFGVLIWLAAPVAHAQPRIYVAATTAVDAFGRQLRSPRGAWRRQTAGLVIFERVTVHRREDHQRPLPGAPVRSARQLELLAVHRLLDTRASSRPAPG